MILAMVSEPVRVAGVLFWVTVKPTVPLPVPVCPKEMVIQLVLLREVHAQLDALAVTVMVESLLLVPKVALVGESWKVHCARTGIAASESRAAMRKHWR